MKFAGKWPWLLAVAALAVAVVLLFLVLDGAPPPGEGPEEPTAAAKPPAEPTVAPLSKEQIRQEPETPVEPATEPVPAAPRANLRLRAVDPAKQPLPEAELTFLRFGWGVLPPSLRHPAETQRVEAGQDGIVDWESCLPAGETRTCARFDLSCPGHTTVEVQATVRSGALLEMGDVVLSPAAEVEGRVVDEQGLPVAGALVLAKARILGEDPNDHGTTLAVPPRATSAPDGSFRLAGLPRSKLRLLAHTALDPLGFARRIGRSEVIDARNKPRISGVTVTLVPEPPPERCLSGHVVDERGNPLPDILVEVLVLGTEPRFMIINWQAFLRTRSVGWTDPTTATDASGAFRVFCTEKSLAEVKDAEISLRFVDGSGTFGPTLLSPVHLAQNDLVAVMGAPQRMRVSCVDPKGRPVTGRSARLYPPHGWGLNVMVEFDAHPASNVIEVEDPARDFIVLIRGEGYRIAWVGPFETGAAPAEVTAVLEPYGAWTGTVTRDGESIAGARVHLRNSPPLRDECAALPRVVVVRKSRFVNCHDVNKAVTDAAGRFALRFGRDAFRQHPGLLKPGERDPYPAAPPLVGLYMIVEADGCAPLCRHLPARERAQTIDLGEIPMTSGAVLSGRLLGPRPEDGELFVAVSRRTGFVRYSPVTEEGEYRLESLEPGPWRVAIIGPEHLQGTGFFEDRAKGRVRGRDLQRDSSALIAIPEGGLTLDLRVERAAEAVVHLVPRLTGCHVDRWDAHLQLPGGDFQDSVRSDPEHPLELRLPLHESGRWLLCLTGYVDTPVKATIGFVELLALDPGGEVTWEVCAAAGDGVPFELADPGPQGAGQLVVANEVRPGCFSLASVEWVRKGTYRVPFVFAGDNRVVEVGHWWQRVLPEELRAAPTRQRLEPASASAPR